MKKYVILLMLITVYKELYAQYIEDISPIKFTYHHQNQDVIKLIVENTSNSKTYYYSIGVQGLTDTGWMELLGDINSLGQNDFLALKPIKHGSRVSKSISKKKILFLYAYYRIKKIKFDIVYYEKQDFESKSRIIYLPQM